jgi:flavin reductase (DIM6/NTAB) family NADH-FMN oxidoreductase RutF
MVDPKDFWRALGERPIGVTLVAAKGADGPAGFLGLSATHVSGNPPSMMVSIDGRTSAMRVVLEARHFAVSCVPAEAAALIDVFGGKTELKAAERFTNEDWTSLTTGAPVLKRAPAAFDCVLDDTFAYAGSTIVVGRVVDLRVTQGETVIYLRGRYSAGDK